MSVRVLGMLDSYTALILSAFTLLLAPARILVVTNFDTSSTLLILSVADRFQLLSSVVLLISGPVASWILVLAVLGSYSRSSKLLRFGSPVAAALAALWLILTQPLGLCAAAIAGLVLNLTLARRAGILISRRKALRGVLHEYNNLDSRMSADFEAAEAATTELGAALAELRQHGRPTVRRQVSSHIRRTMRDLVERSRSKLPSNRTKLKLERLDAEIQELGERIKSQKDKQGEMRGERDRLAQLISSPSTLLPEEFFSRALLTVLGVAILALLVSGPWVPPETIGGKADRYSVFIVGEQFDQILVLDYRTREVRWIPPNSVVDRQICSVSKAQWISLSIPNLVAQRAKPICLM